MYDKSLLEDLKNFKAGSDNIYELEYRYRDIIKIIKNRTKEKLYLLQIMLEYNVIDINICKELFKRVQSDYRLGFLYLIGKVKL